MIGAILSAWRRLRLSLWAAKVRLRLRRLGMRAEIEIGPGVRYETLGRKGTLDVAPFRRLSKLLREEQFEVLHAHKFGSNLWGSIVGRLSRTPVIVAHEHSWAYSGDAKRRILDGQVIGRLADVMVAVCAEAAPSMALSWKARKPIDAPSSSIADGIAVRVPVAIRPQIVKNISSPLALPFLNELSQGV